MFKIPLLLTPLLLNVLVAGSGVPAAGQQPHADVFGSRGSATPASDSSNAEFEVATVKRTGPATKAHPVQIANALFVYPGARIEVRGANLEFLLMEAYNLPPAQILGGPKWIRETRFDIEAKPPADVASRYLQPRSPKSPPPDEVRAMLRNLLAERFNLVLHLQQNQGKALALARSGRNLRLDPSKDDQSPPWAGGVDGGLPTGIGLRGTNETMADLASRLSRWLSQPVVDQTGISGSYDFLVVFDQSEIASGMRFDDSIFESLKELGLKLIKSTALVQTLVVEQASLPSDS